MVAVLAARASPLALLYGAATLAALAYHWHDQQRWVRTDHVLAWACIASNLWLAWHCRWYIVAAAVVAIIGALQQYTAAHREQYDRHHTWWHAWCGVAGVLLAAGSGP